MRFALIVLAVSLSLPSFAGKLQDAKNKKEIDEALNKPLEHMNQTCGTKMTASLDMKTFERAIASGFHGASAGHYCGSVMDAVRHICEKGDAEKKEITNRIHKIECAYKDGVTTKEFPKNVKLDGSTLKATFSKDTGNITDGAKEYLMSEL